MLAVGVKVEGGGLSAREEENDASSNDQTDAVNRSSKADPALLPSRKVQSLFSDLAGVPKRKGVGVSERGLRSERERSSRFISVLQRLQIRRQRARSKSLLVSILVERESEEDVPLDRIVLKPGGL